jgi:hypothetical protein
LNSSATNGTQLTNVKAFLEYPNDIKIVGLSAATTQLGVSWGAELSHQTDVPVATNSADTLIGVGSYNRAAQAVGPMGSRVLAAGALGYVRGWDLFNKTQLQVNGVGILPSILGAVSGSVIGEFMMQWNNLPDYKTAGNLRYGRAQEFGYAVSANPGGFAGGTAAAYQAVNPTAVCNATVFGPQFQKAGCEVDGFITGFSWGYRLRGQLDYPNAFDSGMTMSPIVFFAHDVDGVSMDGQLNKGRKTLSLTMRLNKNKAHNLDLTYTTYANSAKYDALRDRDNYSLAYSYTF